MPWLRHLHLSLGDHPVSPVVAYNFHEALQLRSVVLEKFAPSNVELPWAQLTSMTLSDVYRSEYLRLLRQTSSNLLHCALSIIFESYEEGDPCDIALPRLESLTLKDGNSKWAPTQQLRDVFIVPALRSLRISESFL
ncbi:hypothetical protein B0H17DRAFT_1208146 [Mycena rosella]|uniref:Uncharacterized protein n=1 Tax=Mycena rosella TaxID=1033263 RepID=A0AAD7D1W1_MYCRO|nr:hypothetical protein B0H17DRAFT_1208146 [Mycena rosella]